MRSIVWGTTMTVWAAGLAVCMVAIVAGWDSVVVVAAPVMFGAGAVGVVLCYGMRHALVVLVPLIAVVAVVGWAALKAGLPSGVWAVVVPIGVGLIVSRVDRVGLR
jgi:hypothetical protein